MSYKVGDRVTVMASVGAIWEVSLRDAAKTARPAPPPAARPEADVGMYGTIDAVKLAQAQLEDSKAKVQAAKDKAKADAKAARDKARADEKAKQVAQAAKERSASLDRYKNLAYATTTALSQVYNLDWGRHVDATSCLFEFAPELQALVGEFGYKVVVFNGLGIVARKG